MCNMSQEVVLWKRCLLHESIIGKTKSIQWKNPCRMSAENAHINCSIQELKENVFKMPHRHIVESFETSGSSSSESSGARHPCAAPKGAHLEGAPLTCLLPPPPKMLSTTYNVVEGILDGDNKPCSMPATTHRQKRCQHYTCHPRYETRPFCLDHGVVLPLEADDRGQRLPDHGRPLRVFRAV